MIRRTLCVPTEGQWDDCHWADVTSVCWLSSFCPREELCPTETSPHHAGSLLPLLGPDQPQGLKGQHGRQVKAGVDQAGPSSEYNQYLPSAHMTEEIPRKWKRKAAFP